MEFITGLLFATVAYLLYQYFQLKKYNHLHYKTINRLLLLDDKHDKDILEMHYLLGKLDQQMREDSYKSLTETNKTVSDTIDNLKTLTTSFNQQDLAIQDSFREIEKRFQSINGNLSTINSHIENTAN